MFLITSLYKLYKSGRLNKKYHFFVRAIMDCCKTWLAFLGADVIQRCVDCCEQECPACKNGLLSPLLHFHNQYSLREKLDTYYYKTIQQLDIAALFDRFILRFGWFSLNREEFVNMGQSFVRLSTPDALFYGKYITKENDFDIYGSTDHLFETVTAEKPIKAKKRKKSVISQDGVSGASTEN